MQVNFINEKATGLSKVSFRIQSQFTFGQGIINNLHNKHSKTGV